MDAHVRADDAPGSIFHTTCNAHEKRIAQIGHGDADPLGFSGQGKGGDCQQQHRKEG